MNQEMPEFSSFSVWDRTAEDRGYYVVLNYKLGGKHKKKTKALKAENKKEATREAASIFTAALEDAREYIGSKLKLSEYFQQFLDTRETIGDISKSTLSSYRYLAPSIVKGLHDEQICLITHTKIQNWVNKEQEEGALGPDSIIKRVNLLHALFEYALLHGDVKSNPVKGIRKPKRERKTINILDAATIKHLMSVLKSNNDLPFRALITIGITTGMRPSETCALMWHDVNMQTGEIFIHQAISRSKGTAFLSPYTKNTGSTRRIFLSGIALDCLRDMQNAQQELCKDAGIPWRDDLFVLGDIEGNFLSPISSSKKWNTFARTINIVGTQKTVPHLYDLRHTFATVAIKNGVDIETVSNSMGHTNVAMTLNTYASADPEAKKALADTMGTIFDWDTDI